MTPARRVLFVGHDAARTGAPILLLHFLRWFKANSDIPFEIVLRRSGELQPEFEAIGRVSLWPHHYSGLQGLAAGARRRRLAARLGRADRALVYSNTMTNGDIVESLVRAGHPVVSHVHELETMIRSYGARNFEMVKRHTRRYIACAEAVRANLIENHAVEGHLIDVVHEFIAIGPETTSRTCDVRARMLAALGIPADSLVVGACGTTDWRKAPDLFIQLARLVRLMRPNLPAHFVWVGGAQSGSTRFAEIQHDIRGIQMSGRIHFLGARPDALDHFRIFDVFALVSREDPFPLACLEVASLGKPIVCFDGAGGMGEFVEHDCGFVVPYLDVEAMALSTVRLLESEELRRSCGSRASAKVRARHDVTIAAPRIARIIEAQL